MPSSTQGFAVAGSETPVRAAGLNYAAASAIAVTGGGRRTTRGKGSVPIGLAALVAAVVLLWIGLAVNDAVEGVARGVVGVLAVLAGLRAVDAFKRAKAPLGVVFSVVAAGLALFAILGPVDAVSKIIVVLASSVMMFIA